MHQSIKNRLSSLGLEAWDLGGGGDCFFHCLAPLVEMTVSVLRRCVAQHMRDNEYMEALAILNFTGDISPTATWWVHVEFTLKATLKSLPPPTLFCGTS